MLVFLQWWSVDEVEQWAALLELRRFPHDEALCVQQAIRNGFMSGETLLTLATLATLKPEQAVATLEMTLRDSSVAKASALNTTELAEMLIREKIAPLAQLPPQLKEPEPKPEPEPEPEQQQLELEPEPGPESIPEGIPPVEPGPGPEPEPEPGPEPELEIDPAEVEAQLQLVLSKVPFWSMNKPDRSERLPAQTCRYVEQKFREFKKAREIIDDRGILERSTFSMTATGGVSMAETISKNTKEVLVDEGTINFQDMVIRTTNDAGDDIHFTIKYHKHTSAEAEDAENFRDRRNVLTTLFKGERDYVEILNELRQLCFAPVEEKVAEKPSTYGPYPQVAAFAYLLALHSEFAARLPAAEDSLPVAEEVRVLQMLTEHFERMPPIWATYLQYEHKDTMQMLSSTEISVSEAQLSSLLHKSTGRVIELYVMCKKMDQMSPLEELKSVQASLKKVMDKCGTHPSITGQRQLHLPLSSPLTGTVVPNCCLWMWPTGFEGLIGPESWDANQLRDLGGMRNKGFSYGNVQQLHDVIAEAKAFIESHRASVLCLVLVQDKFAKCHSTSNLLDDNAGMLTGIYRGLDDHCTVFGMHNLDDLVIFYDDPASSDCQRAVKNALSDEIREQQASARDKQALTVLARGKTELEHLYELEEWDGSTWLASKAVVTKRDLLKKLGGTGKDVWQERMVSISASELKWNGGGLGSTDITQVNRRLAWDKELEGYGFEVISTAKGGKTYKFLAANMEDRDDWVKCIEKLAKKDQGRRPQAFCREDFTFRDSPEDFMLPVEPNGRQYVFVGEYHQMQWEYGLVSDGHWTTARRINSGARRRKWWCFKQLLTGESFKQVDPQKRDWGYVKRLDSLLATLDGLVSTDEPLDSQSLMSLQDKTKEGLVKVLRTDDERGHHEVAAWFLRTITTAISTGHTQMAVNVLQMVKEVNESVRFGERGKHLRQLASLLRSDIDPLLSENVTNPRVAKGPTPPSAPVTKLAEECRRQFRGSMIELPMTKHCDESNLHGVHELLDKLARDPHRWELSERERKFLWTHRGAEFLHQDGRMLSKVLLATPDWDVDGREAEGLLKLWKTPLTPLEALALLDDRFWQHAKMRFVKSGDERSNPVQKRCSDETTSFRPFRTYAVNCLGVWSDEEFCRYMLQMAVVLRTQMHSFDLVRLLLQRASRSPDTVGHALYWHVRAEMSGCLAAIKREEDGEGEPGTPGALLGNTPVEVFARLAIILRTYLNLCPAANRAALQDQEEYLVQPLKEIAAGIISQSKAGVEQEALKVWLRTELPSRVELRDDLTLPVDSNTRVTAVVQDKCIVLKSATKALWLNFETLDGKGVHVIFKDGDDLRQDELVLQAFALMQELWTKAGLLDIGSLSIYSVADLGGKVGMITPVPHSHTLASIFIEKFEIPEGGGMREKIATAPKIVGAVLAEPEAFYDWIEAKRGDVSEEAARKNFMHSCAGYCVATFMLGLGDRHSSNIMLKPDGHLVHIDFGWWLGRNPTRPAAMRTLFEAFGASTDYDDNGFAFVPSFAYVIVGPEVWKDKQLPWWQSARFAEFTELCCECYKVIRNRAHDFINVFSVMLAADIGDEVEQKHGGGSMKLDAAALKTLRASLSSSSSLSFCLLSLSLSFVHFGS